MRTCYILKYINITADTFEKPNMVKPMKECKYKKKCCSVKCTLHPKNDRLIDDPFRGSARKERLRKKMTTSIKPKPIKVKAEETRINPDPERNVPSAVKNPVFKRLNKRDKRDRRRRKHEQHMIDTEKKKVVTMAKLMVIPNTLQQEVPADKMVVLDTLQQEVPADKMVVLDTTQQEVPADKMVVLDDVVPVPMVVVDYVDCQPEVCLVETTLEPNLRRRSPVSLPGQRTGSGPNGRVF